MVLRSTGVLSSAFGVREGPTESGFNIEKLNNRTLGNIFFNLCKVCQIKSMSSIPPSAFSASRIRETQREMKLSNTNKGKESTKFFNTTLVELSPLKYNSKLMNSIWGLYNRYSPHNVKKVNEAYCYGAGADLQQSAANPLNKNESVISLSKAKLDNVWAAVNVRQSH